MVMFGGIWLILVVWQELAPVYTQDNCDTQKIRQCLQPILQHAINKNAKYSTSYTEKLLERSLGHYFNTLSDNHDNTVHIHSLEDILMPLDGLLFSQKLADSCRIFKQGEMCVHDAKLWCAEEVRDILEGLEDVFSLSCSEPHTTVFQNHSSCLANMSGSPQVAVCQRSFNQSIHNLVQTLQTRQQSRLEDENYAQLDITDPSKNQVRSLEEFIILVTRPYGNDSFKSGFELRNTSFAEETNILKSSVVSICEYVAAALECNHLAVYTRCGYQAAIWESKLRLALVQLLLIDLGCADPALHLVLTHEDDACFNCTDGIGCVKDVLICNGIKDCTDSSDEDPKLCTRLPQSTSVLAKIIIGVLIGVIALIAVIFCIVKCREKDSDDESNSDKDFVMEEQGLQADSDRNGQPIKYSELNT